CNCISLTTSCVITTGNFAKLLKAERSIAVAINPQHTVIGLFDERGLADKAVDDLQNAGFSADQIYYSGPGQNPDTDFWHGIKGLFTHDKATSHNELARQLKDLGFSDDEISNYQNQYDIGRTVVAVKAASREDEALVLPSPAL